MKMYVNVDFLFGDIFLRDICQINKANNKCFVAVKFHHDET